MTEQQTFTELLDCHTLQAELCTAAMIGISRISAVELFDIGDRSFRVSVGNRQFLITVEQEK